MPLIDKFKKKKPKNQTGQSRKQLDPLPYILDGTYVKSIELMQTSIEYIPLTLGEMQELSPPNSYEDSYVIRAIAKAFRKQLDEGLLERADVLKMDENKSPYWNAKAMFLDMPRRTRELLVTTIRNHELTTINHIVNIFREEGEEYNGSDLKGVSRVPGRIDDFLSVGYTLDKTPYKYQDICDLTPLQYQILVNTKTERDVRSANDHEAHSRSFKPTSTETATPTKKYVGG